MNMPEVRCFFSLEDGTVAKLPPGDQRLPEIRSQKDRYVAIEAVPSRIQYEWLDTFIKNVEDDGLRARLEGAINGKGAFRRFKDILLTIPDERRRWFEFRDEALRARIVDWVREQGVEAVNLPEWEEQPEERPRAHNRPRDVEALRDLLIEWADGKDPREALTPLELEKLAQIIGQGFKVRPI